MLRLIWLLVAGGVEPHDWMRSGDQFSYFHYAEEIAAGRGYVSYTTGEATAYYPVGYPALLAAAFWTVEHTPLPGDLAAAGGALNLILGTASVGLVFAIGRSVAGIRAGLVAAAVVALFPNLIFYTATFALETAFIYFALLSIAVLATHEWSIGPPSPARLAVFAVVLGASALIRPFSVLFLAGVAIALVLVSGWRRTSVSALFVLLPLVLVLTPWTVRNALRFDAFVPFSTNLGDTACLDRSPGSTGGFRWAAHDWCAPPDLPEVRRNSENLRLAARFIREHPGMEARLIGHRFVDMMSHDHSGLEEAEANHVGELMGDRLRRFFALAADAYFFLVAAFGSAGVVVLGRRWREWPMRPIVLVALAGLLAVPLGLWGNPRFHVPLVPLLAVSAAAGVTALASAPVTVQRNESSATVG